VGGVGQCLHAWRIYRVAAWVCELLRGHPGLAQGQTILDRKKIGYPQHGWGDDIPDAQVCMQVDAAAAGRVFETTLMGDWLAKA